jgi:hypothetical protein
VLKLAAALPRQVIAADRDSMVARFMIPPTAESLRPHSSPDHLYSQPDREHSEAYNQKQACHYQSSSQCKLMQIDPPLFLSRRCRPYSAALPLRRFLGSNYDQDDPTRQQQSAQYRRERNGLLGINAGLKWANVNSLLAACVADSLVGKSHDPKNDKSDANKRYRIDTHRIYFFVFAPK